MTDFDAVDEEIRALSSSLRGADEATVSAEVERLKALAEEIEDERDRQLALIRAAKLPELIRGPQPGTSPEYWRAASLVTQVVNANGTAAEQIVHAERAIAEIGALARAAPEREFRTILRMNSTLQRLIRRRRREHPDLGS